MAQRIQLRRDTAANWTSVDPVLAPGELGVETDTGRVKLGNGIDAWTVLPYSFETGGLSSDIVDALNAANAPDLSNPFATMADVGGGGDVTKVGTPVNNQVGVWTGDGTIEGDTNLTFDTSTDTLTTVLITATTVTANLTGNISGNAATVTTNANLTGDVTSIGNATTIANGAVDIVMLSASGTPDNTTFLRGDNTWSVVASGASLFPVTGTGTATGAVIGDLANNDLTISNGGAIAETADSFNYTADTHTFNSGGNIFLELDGTQFSSRLRAEDGDASATLRLSGDLVGNDVQFRLEAYDNTNEVVIEGDAQAQSITHTAANGHIFEGPIILNGTTSGTINLASDALSNVAIGTNLSGAGIIPFVQSIIVRSDETLTNSNADQNLFTNTAHDVITVQASTTYEFYITGDFTHGAVSHSIALGFTPTTAVVTSIEYNAYSWVTAVGTATASQVSTRVKATATSVINLAGANATETFEAKGTITIGATGGTITPQIKFSADPTGTILLKTGARMMIWPIGNDTFIQQGNIG